MDKPFTWWLAALPKVVSLNYTHRIECKWIDSLGVTHHLEWANYEQWWRWYEAVTLGVGHTPMFDVIAQRAIFEEPELPSPLPEDKQLVVIGMRAQYRQPDSFAVNILEVIHYDITPRPLGREIIDTVARGRRAPTVFDRMLQRCCHNQGYSCY